jgi:bifunctional DNA-binding transcriptional regulator/antitoxin component of YhaV-PrlF toxin-antitoxin module
MDKKRVKFGKLKIQQLNRVAIPNSLLENLGLKISDDVELFLDIEKEEIVIKKSKNE